MKEIKFSGSSDDLIYVYGEEYCEYGNMVKKPFYVMSAIENTGLKVYPIYDGCWQFSVGLIDDDDVLPDWEISLGLAHAYSVELTIMAPDDVVVKREL